MSHLTVILQADAPEVGRVAEPVDWPLHVTALQAFRVKAHVEDVVESINAALATHEPLVVTGAASERFGPRADVEVTVLRTSDRLVALHRELLASLGALPGFEPDEPAYSGEGFRAHVTASRDAALGVGSSMRLAWSGIVDMDAGPKVVASNPLAAPPIDSRSAGAVS